MTLNNPRRLQAAWARELKQAMRNLGNGKTHEQAARAQAQAQASLEMARATRMKAQSLQDMMAQQLFGTNIAENFDPMVHEY